MKNCLNCGGETNGKWRVLCPKCGTSPEVSTDVATKKATPQKSEGGEPSRMYLFVAGIVSLFVYIWAMDNLIEVPFLGFFWHG